MSNDAFPGLVPGRYTFDPAHTQLGFVVRHIVTKVRGQFTKYDGEIVITENPLESTASAEIDLSSVDTGTKQRDDHLRSSDFFDVESHSLMSFETTGLRLDGDTLIATGNLTIKEVTKPIELEVEYGGTDSDPWGGTRLGFEATAQISRKVWGINFNIPLEGDKVVIGDQVKINLTVEAVLQQDAVAPDVDESAA
jgi:polyisoprenoid-binding protein YceI